MSNTPSNASNSSVRYLVFDVESVADGPLVAKLRYAASRSSRRRPCGSTATS